MQGLEDPLQLCRLRLRHGSPSPCQSCEESPCAPDSSGGTLLPCRCLNLRPECGRSSESHHRLKSSALNHPESELFYKFPSQYFQLICACFETQFDECIVDRPLIVNAIKILLTQLPEEQTLSFDFFIQRFETLVLEAQLSSQSEETVFVQGRQRDGDKDTPSFRPDALRSHV